MLLYCTKRRFMFVHNPRTGGSSIANALSRHGSPLLHGRIARLLWHGAPPLCCRMLGWRRQLLDTPHTTAAQAREIFPSELFEQSFKFGFARNPWDWNVSLYFYIRQTPSHAQFPIVDAMSGFDEFVEWRVTFESGKQKSFFYDTEGNCLVNFVGRFEALQSDFAEVCQRIEINASLPALNGTTRNADFRSYYTPRTYNLIGDFFRDDIETFRYG